MMKPRKDDDLRNRMGGLVWSTFQKVQRIHELEFLYASFLLSFRYCSCILYTDYASTKKSPKKLCYVINMLLPFFVLWCCYGLQYMVCLYE